MQSRFVLGLALSFAAGLAGHAGAEGALPAPGSAATSIPLGAVSGEYTSDGAFVFRNAGTASSRLLLPPRDAVACEPDGQGTSRSRPGQFLISGGAELRCTASPGRYRFTAMSSEGGSIREQIGKLVVR